MPEALRTPFEEKMTGEEWNLYPRPLMKRDSYFPLNGEWDLFRISGEDAAKILSGMSLGEGRRSGKYAGRIRLPFPPESRLSGIGQTLKKGERWLYRRTISSPEEIPALKEGERLLLHCGAADQVCTVVLNGRVLRSHEGGYLPFETDLTPAWKQSARRQGTDENSSEDPASAADENSVKAPSLTAEENSSKAPSPTDLPEDGSSAGINVLELLVQDDHLPEYGLGKQSLKRGGMWYTAHSGVWQSVWAEILPANGFLSVCTEPILRFDEKTGDLLSAEVLIRTEGGEGKKTLRVREKVCFFSAASIRIRIDDPKLWTPETPELYEFTLENGTDRISSYFALRQITVEKRHRKDGRELACLCLNRQPLFLHGLLDQGYFPDGIVLPASPEGYAKDVGDMKRLGFNLLRKHIKIEPEVYYYECDRQGMLVMQDMVNSGTYSFLTDTVLPTIGLQRGLSHHASLARSSRFEADCLRTMDLLKGHPGVIGFTIFNEGWGQYSAAKLYKELKSREPGMIFDTASGWFKTGKSDVLSDHIYFRKIKVKADRRAEKPLILSEYGGYALSLKGHVFNTEKEYGYRRFTAEETLQKGLDDLLEKELIPAIQSGLCGAVLTQVSDVEDETNGMVTYDRKIIKVNEDRMRELAAELNKTFEDCFQA